MKHLKYKGYIGIVEFDFDDNLLYGKVANTNDLISFSGKDLAELKQSFEESIDSYIEICEEMGEVPEKPYNGRFQVRATPELHKELFISAIEEDMSLNGFVVQCLEESLKRRQTKQTMALPEQSKEKTIFPSTDQHTSTQ